MQGALVWSVIGELGSPMLCGQKIYEVKWSESCLVVSDSLWPMDYTVYDLQARILEWVAFPFSRGSSQPRDWIQVCRIAGGFFTNWVTREGLICNIYIYILQNSWVCRWRQGQRATLRRETGAGRAVLRNGPCAGGDLEYFHQETSKPGMSWGTDPQQKPPLPLSEGNLSFSLKLPF